MDSRWSPGLLALMLALGCGTPRPSGETEASSTGSTSASTSTVSSGPTAADGSSSGGSSSTGLPPSFDCPPEQLEDQCDLEAQDCPEGLHCVPWDPDGDGNLDAVTCGPLSETPVEPFGECTIDPDACTDDCGLGTICDPRFETPRCMPVCDMVQGDDATCSPGELCVTCAECAVGACFPGCDPLAPQCTQLEGDCFSTDAGNGFVCAPGMLGEGVLDEECMGINSCTQGLYCVTGGLLDQCDGQACCTELCDLVDGDPGCSNPAHVCFTLFHSGPVPAGQGHVGVCASPMDISCDQPGTCQPPGIDDTLPWCSTSNVMACEDGRLGGYGDVIACEGGCLCNTPCAGAGAGDCPVPPTGTAMPECVVEPFGPGSPTSCMLSCAGAETCPDGMTCTDQLTGQPTCTWVTPLPPQGC